MLRLLIVICRLLPTGAFIFMFMFILMEDEEEGKRSLVHVLVYVRLLLLLLWEDGIPITIARSTTQYWYSFSSKTLSCSWPCILADSSRQAKTMVAVLCLRGASVRYRSREIW